MQAHQVASPGSMCEISFRILNLCASIHSGAIGGTGEILTLAKDADADLRTWEEVLPASWRYSVVGIPRSRATGMFTDDEQSLEAIFGEQQHIYPSIWIAEAWDSWRMLRIVVSQIILHHSSVDLDAPSKTRSEAVDTIQRLSRDVCVSHTAFEGTSSKCIIPPNSGAAYSTYD
jgi:hypothetical protein